MSYLKQKNNPNPMHLKRLVIMVAANQTKHCTMLYIENLTTAERQEAIRMYFNHIDATLPVDKNGNYMLSWVNRVMWGTNSESLHGPIALFHRKLNIIMAKRFGEDRISFRPTHVDVKGNFGEYLYPSFNIKNVTIL